MLREMFKLRLVDELYLIVMGVDEPRFYDLDTSNTLLWIRNPLCQRVHTE
jgi:hypothetical protein